VRRLTLAAALVLLAACEPRREPAPQATAPAPPEPAAAAEPALAGPAVAPEARVAVAAALTPDGYGPVRIGMTEAEARAALGGQVASDADTGVNETCHHIWAGPRNALSSLVYMVENGRVSRVTAHLDSRVKTDRGLGVGDTEAQVRAAYPTGLEVEPHHYIGEPAHYLTFWTEPGRRGVRYETDERGIVREVHAGDRSIRYIEGCA
jgi:hypothetical protein